MAAARREVDDTAGQLRVAVVEHRASADVAAVVGVAVARRGDDAGSRIGRHRHQRSTDVSGRAADQDGLPRSDPRVNEQRQVRSCRRMRQHRHVHGPDVIGQPVEPVDGDHCQLSRRTLPTVVAEAVATDPVARPEADDGRSGRHHPTGKVAPDDERERHGGAPRSGTDECVDVVDGGNLHLDEHIRRAVHRVGNLAVLDRTGRPQRLDISSLHDPDSLSYRC